MNAKLRLMAALLFLVAGCGPSERQLRERSFRATADSSLRMAIHHVDRYRDLHSINFAKDYASDMKKDLSKCPDVRYDDNLGYVIRRMEIIAEVFGFIATSQELVGDYVKPTEPLNENQKHILELLKYIDESAKAGLKVLDGEPASKQPLITLPLGPL
jgi:hypothetical protein